MTVLYYCSTSVKLQLRQCCSVSIKKQSGQHGSTSQSNNSQDNMAVLHSQTTVRTIWQWFIVKQQSGQYGSTTQSNKSGQYGSTL